jgi:hypothetical protein
MKEEREKRERMRERETEEEKEKQKEKRNYTTRNKKTKAKNINKKEDRAIATVTVGNINQVRGSIHNDFFDQFLHDDIAHGLEYEIDVFGGNGTREVRVDRTLGRVLILFYETRANEHPRFLHIRTSCSSEIG